MSEGKPLSLPEIMGIESDFRLLEDLAQNSHFPNVSNIGIDSIRIIVLKRTIDKLSFEGWHIEKVRSHTRISKHVKKKLLSKEMTSLHYLIAPSGFKNIMLETPHSLNASSDYKKYHLVIFGLSQPNKPLNNAQINDITRLLKRLEIDEIDICIDSPHMINDRAFKTFGKHKKCYSTLYVNNPLGLNYVRKICYYDKRFKDKLKEPLYRLELTCKTCGKVGTIFIPYDEVQIIFNTLIFKGNL